MSTFDERRAAAVADATNPVSRAILEAMPRMVGHPVPPSKSPHPGEGSAGVCVQDSDIGGALGCTAREGYILNRAVTIGRPKRMLEIGSYVGWSSAHLVYGNAAKLVCLDSLTEGPGHLLETMDGRILQRFHENITSLNLSPRVTFIPGESPGDLSRISPDAGWDFVFLDGWHLDGQPLRDVKGLLPHMHEAGVIFLHDVHMPDVREAATHLTEEGWVFTGFLTPNMLSAFWKVEPKWWGKFLESFE